MNQKFTFTGKEKMVSLIMAGFGGLLIAIGFLTAGDDAFAWNRVWTNILHNSVFFLGISFLSMFFYAAFTTAYAGWFVVFKRVMEALTAFIPIGGAFIILVAVGAALGWNDIYYWMTEGLTDPAAENFDKIIYGKKGFLNIPYFLASTIGFVVVWTFFAMKFRSISKSEDTAEKGSITTYAQLKKWTAAFLPIGASTSAFAIWYWIMSIEPHWYSTMFAWYATGSLMSCAIAVVMLSLYYLQSRGYYEEVLLTHYHDLGKFLFAFSIFWTYLWFSQYMLIWYANIGEETVHFQNQLKDFPILFYGMLILNFALPLIILMRNTNKYRKGSVIFMCIVILFGHWLDFFLMIKQGVYYELGHAAHAGEGGGHHEMEFMFGYNLPGLIEIGIMLGFLGLFIYVFFNALGKSNLVPTNDPYLEESLHHQGGPLGPELDVHH